MTTTTTTVAVN